MESTNVIRKRRRRTGPVFIRVFTRLLMPTKPFTNLELQNPAIDKLYMQQFPDRMFHIFSTPKSPFLTNEFYVAQRRRSADQEALNCETFGREMEISTLAARTLAVVVASSDKNNELFFSLPNGEPEILTFGNKWKIKQGQRRSNYQLRIRREQVSCAFFTVLLQGDGGAFLCLVFARNE